MTTNTQPQVLTDDEINEIADPFGFFKSGDSQGDVRLNFARAIEAAIAAKQPATMQLEQGWQDIATAPMDSSDIFLGHPDGSLAVGRWGRRQNAFVDLGGVIAWATHWKPKFAPPPLAAQGEKA